MKFKALHHLRPASFKDITTYYPTPQIIPKKELFAYLDYFKSIAKYTNMDTEAYVMMGFCYRHLNKTVSAIKYFKKALSLNLSNFWALYNLGAIYYQEEEFQKVIEPLEKAITITMKKNIDYLSTSRLYFMFETDPNQFIYLIKSGLRDGYRDSFKMLALSYQKLEQFSNMRKTAMSAVAFGVGQRDFFFYLAGLASYHMKDYQNAIKLFSKTISINPQHALAYYYSSLCFSKMNQHKLAQIAFNKANYLKKTHQDKSFYNEYVGLRVF